MLVCVSFCSQFFEWSILSTQSYMKSNLLTKIKTEKKTFNFKILYD